MMNKSQMTFRGQTHIQLRFVHLCSKLYHHLPIFSQIFLTKVLKTLGSIKHIASYNVCVIYTSSQHTDLCFLSTHQAGKGVVHAMCECVFLQDDEQAGVVEVAGHGRDEILHSLSLSLLQTCARNTRSQKSGTSWHTYTAY